MSSKESLAVFLASLGTKSYYQMLRVPADASPAEVQAAFHSFSMMYHPDRYFGAEGVVELASEIYKRGVEAYRCLARPGSRARYDRALARGKLRFDASHPSTPPPPPLARTLETIATTTRGRVAAAKADRLLAIGRLDEARVQLVTACQNEPSNDELAERLQLLYELLSLEP
ncbi:MAG: DnaJ domain-containing protein [Myxococcota bacterium]|nr:DnaJ domain-containing protein [Myxococcota bacterium]